MSSAGIPIKAIYFVQGRGQLSQGDLQAHPEVLPTNSFEEFKLLARSRVALWIDINAVGQVDTMWLGKSPQRFYPVVLVGDGEWYCSFLRTLRYFEFEEPPYDCSSPAPGFSVNMQIGESGGGKGQGYKQTPTVRGILEITDPLLESIR